MKKSSSRVQQFLLGMGIAIVLVAFVMYGINTFYPAPEFKNYCGEGPQEMFSNESIRLKEGGKWHYGAEKCISADSKFCSQGWCDQYYTCQKQLDEATQKYSRIVFFIATITGVLAIVGGLFTIVNSIGGGVMFGGVILLIIGTAQYWTYLSKYVQWLLLGVLLVFLIWIGYKRFGK